jgi:hypothetical protein
MIRSSASRANIRTRLRPFLVSDYSAAALGHRTTRPHLPSATVIRWLTDRPSDDSVIPGAHQYGSLQDVGHPRKLVNKSPAAWQAADNQDVQHVTMKAIIYELIHQQTSSLEKTVPWFLFNMPPSYFRQVPEQFRFDHIKAIAAVKDANMDLYLNLQTHMSDGRQVLTFIRPGTSPGTLLRSTYILPTAQICFGKKCWFSHSFCFLGQWYKSCQIRERRHHCHDFTYFQQRMRPCL